MNRVIFAILLILINTTALAMTKEKAFSRVDVVAHQSFEAEEKVALVVGVGDYPTHSGLGRLNYADDDAQVIGRQLELLGYRVKVLRNAEATKGAILNLLNQLGQVLDPGEGTFLFYFSGHGFAQNKTNYLATYETTPSTVKSSGLALNQVLEKIKAMGAKRQLLLIDACRNDPSKPGTKSVSGGSSFVKFNMAEGSKILFSTKFGGVSYETSDLGGGRGVFSHYVLEGLKGSAKTDLGYITFDSLSEYVTDRVLDYGFKTDRIQKPFVGGESMGDFLLANVGTPSSIEPKPEALSNSFLTVKTTPGNAQIRILNIGPRYVAGMPLKPGRYHLEVSAKDYETERWWVNLTSGEQTIYKELLSMSTEQLKVGNVFQDPFKDGTLGPEMVVIPSGSFMMGSPENEPDRNSAESPQHRVRIANSFALGKYELTFAEYDQFAEATGRKKPDDEGWGRGNRPVINVNWKDAQAYLKWLSEETGKRYRLPSEAEWEYAARAGTTTKYSWGNEVGQNRAHCNRCGSEWDNKKTALVGSFEPNPFGLYDIHGNVYEWVEDCMNDSYHNAPVDGKAWLTGVCKWRVIRGGAWLFKAQALRSAHRNAGDIGARDNGIGFRIARELK